MENVNCPHDPTCADPASCEGERYEQQKIRERRIAQATQARRDIDALTRAQGMAHAMWLKTERNERGQWAIVGKKLQEMLVDTEHYLQDLEAGNG